MLKFSQMRDRVSLETVSVSLPFGISSMAWKVDPTERKACDVLKAASSDMDASRDSVGGIAIAVNQQYTVCSDDCTHQQTLRFGATYS